MVDLTADKVILLDIAHLCVGGHELSYSERNTAIWEAFRLGREYQAMISRSVDVGQPQAGGKEEA
jgi:hypothetical protein